MARAKQAPVETSLNSLANPHSVAEGEQPYGTLLGRLDAAYSFGTLRDPPIEDEQQWRLWLNELRFANMIHLPEAERRALSRCKLSAERARAAAVRRDFLEAYSQIAQSEYFWRVPGRSEESILLGQVESVAAQAVVEYQSGEYLLSSELLLQASQIDKLLAERFGYSHACVHSIHLLGKLVQLEAAQSHFCPALGIAAAALLALSGAPATISSNQWVPNPSLVADTPPSIRRMLSRQIVVEVGAALLFASPAQAKRALDLFYDKSGQAISGPHLNPLSQQWLDAKQLSFSSSSSDSAGQSIAEEHLHRCGSLLTNSRRSAETLWLLGALDAAQRCVSIDSSAARRFRTLAFRDLAAHTAFPGRLRTCWAQLARLTH